MQIIKNGMNCDFKIKIGNDYITVATLQPWLRGNKYNLYFYYYGMEYEKGTYSRQHFNGNVSIVVWEEKDELWTEFIERIEKIVLKKLYVIGNSILEEIKHADFSQCY